MAFPSTAIIDNFNQADGPLGAGWTADVRGSGHAMPQTTSNQVSQTAGSSRRSAFRTTAVTGGRAEVYFTITTAPTDQSVVLGFYYTPGSAGATDGYELGFNSSGVITLDEFANDYATFTTHYTSAGSAFTAGDVVGMLKDDGAGSIEIYKNGNLVTTVTSSTYTGAVNIGFSVRGNAAVDDFGGGAVAPVVRHLGLLGVG